MSHPKVRMSDKLNQTRLIVEGARKPEPLAALLAFGYPQSRLDQGLRHHQTAEQAYLKALKEQSEAVGARDALVEAMRQANTVYIRHVQLARKIFRGNQEVLRTLRVLGPRDDDRTGWLRQASDFYQQARGNQAIEQTFLSGGVDLSTAHATIVELLRLEGELKRERAEAQQARIDRDAAFAQLDRWIEVFVAVARVAFGDSRLLLGQLGL